MWMGRLIINFKLNFNHDHKKTSNLSFQYINLISLYYLIVLLVMIFSIVQRHLSKNISTNNQLRRFLSTKNRFFAESACFNGLPMDLYRLEADCVDKQIVITRKKSLDLLEKMITIRTFEEKANSMYMSRKIRGFCHLSNGQEASNVGLVDSLDENDVICDAYRMHGIAFLRGISVRQILAELCGRSTGSNCGKGGSMHFYKKNNLYGGFGIVGSQVPIAVGVAFAIKYIQDHPKLSNLTEDNAKSRAHPSQNTTNQSNIAIGMYGDGAANQGQVFESFNMAMLYKLPLMFVCENNQYGMGTAVDRSSSCTEPFKRSHFIPGIRVNGQDLISVILAMRFASQYCRSRPTNGPIVIEMNTYRFLGHSMSDPGLSYRTREEIREKRSTCDPIEIFAKRLIDANITDEQEIEDMREKIERLVNETSLQVINDAFPNNKELARNIYGNYIGDLKLVRGRDFSEIYEQ